MTEAASTEVLPAKLENRESNTVAGGSHYAELDGLRGIAIAMVVVFHSPFQVRLAHPSWIALKLIAAWTTLRDGGWAGVDVFFALSGFLITSSLLATRGRPNYYKNFYIRRILRIWPLYFLTLAAVWVVFPHSTKFVVLCTLFLANFSTFFGQAMAYPVLWSLAVEEHFYLLWPWLVKGLSRRNMARVGLAVCVLSPVGRAIALHYGRFDQVLSWFRFDGMMYGALVAVLLNSQYAHTRHLLRWSGWSIGLAIFALVAALPLHSFTRTTVAGAALTYAAVGAISSGVIAYAIARPGARITAPLRYPLLRALGDISYCVYLVHDFVLTPVKKAVEYAGTHLPVFVVQRGWIPYADLLIYLAELTVLALVCGAVGVLARKYIELPTLSLKRYLR